MTKKLEILVVDDEPTNLEVATVILQSAGHEVTTASNGAEAVELCQLQRFDAVLMDVSMPVMDGLEAVRRLRSVPATEQVPILCVSAKTEDTAEKSALEAGCDRYFRKPFTRRGLLDAVNALLVEREALIPDKPSTI